MESELLMVRKRNEELTEKEQELSQYKQEHLAMTKKMNNMEEEFKTTKLSLVINTCYYV